MTIVQELERAVAEQSRAARAWRAGYGEAWLGVADWLMEEAFIRQEIEQMLKAPFPWFGGKSRIAHLVWQRFGRVDHYIEPFAGSLAVLLANPHPPKLETVNDLDCFVANFWRAVKADPDGVAQWADWPVNEIDFHARHRWLARQDEFRQRMLDDPEYYDVKIAGWWVWGVSLWAADGFSTKKRSMRWQRPKPGQGIHSIRMVAVGVDGVRVWFRRLEARLRNVNVLCGDWSRSVTDHMLYHRYTALAQHGRVTAVLLDPPYDVERDMEYTCDSRSVSAKVRKWAIEHGDDPRLRIALCGYEGEHDMPESWECVAWKANGGFANMRNAQGRVNKGRERVWFSPHCLKEVEDADSEGEGWLALGPARKGVQDEGGGVAAGESGVCERIQEEAVE